MQTEDASRGLTLLKKGQKGIIHAIFSRFGLVLVLLILQVLILFGLFQWFEEYLPHIFSIVFTYSLIILFYLKKKGLYELLHTDPYHLL